MLYLIIVTFYLTIVTLSQHDSISHNYDFICHNIIPYLTIMTFYLIFFYISQFETLYLQLWFCILKMQLYISQWLYISQLCLYILQYNFISQIYNITITIITSYFTMKWYTFTNAYSIFIPIMTISRNPLLYLTVWLHLLQFWLYISHLRHYISHNSHFIPHRCGIVISYPTNVSWSRVTGIKLSGTFHISQTQK